MTPTPCEVIWAAPKPRLIADTSSGVWDLKFRNISVDGTNAPDGKRYNKMSSTCAIRVPGTIHPVPPAPEVTRGDGAGGVRLQRCPHPPAPRLGGDHQKEPPSQRERAPHPGPVGRRGGQHQPEQHDEEAERHTVHRHGRQRCAGRGSAAPAHGMGGGAGGWRPWKLFRGTLVAFFQTDRDKKLKKNCENVNL